MSKYKVGQRFPYEKFQYRGEPAEENMRYFVVEHWFGLDFLPIRKFITLALKKGEWEVLFVD